MKGLVRRNTLALVSEKWPLHSVEMPRLSSAEGGGVLLEAQTAALLQGLLKDTGSRGRIVPVSGWRSVEEQRAIWDSAIARGGEDYARSFVALPGCSEHHTGLAVDLALGEGSRDIITPDFPQEGICALFKKRAPAYGFILRYPRGKEHITGIAHESWHFRYVGIPHAKIMTAMELCLEEYLELLERGQRLSCTIASYEFLVAYGRDPAHPPELFGSEGSGIVSADNRGGYVFTGIREL